MQIIKTLRTLILFLLPLSVFSQSSYIPLGSKDYDLINRLEIKSGNTNLMFSTVKPLNRRLYTREVQSIDSMSADTKQIKLTNIDKYNIQRYLMNNSEWANPNPSFASKKPLFTHFYKTPANFYEVNTTDFFLAVNPVIQYQQRFEQNNNQNLFYNSRGISVRGLISRKVGFDIYITDNQERNPSYVQQYTKAMYAVPGARFYKPFKAAGGVDYFDNRASISFNASKYIDIQLGYDRNFIGDGYRSLLLSDFSPNALFLKFNTRIWKLNYENLFMELVPTLANDTILARIGGNAVIPRKYFRMNYLNFNATKWLNIGLYDAVAFGRKDHFDFQYLIPVMFLRPAESDIGSGDNAVVGLTVKANVKKTFQVYGQFSLDEFRIKEIFKSNGYWGNKFGYQLGVKYPDAFGIKNLDLQLENNRIRPFTYSHRDSVADFSHVNQPLTHPLGAGIQENIFIVKYQPIKKVYLQARAIYYIQGLDTAGKDFGSNILRNYDDRSGSNGLEKDFGYYIGSGNKVKCLNFSFYATYELRENLFIDASLLRRQYSMHYGGDNNTTVFSLGFRLNSMRRVFDF